MLSKKLRVDRYSISMGWMWFRSEYGTEAHRPPSPAAHWEAVRWTSIFDGARHERLHRIRFAGQAVRILEGLLASRSLETRSRDSDLCTTACSGSGEHTRGSLRRRRLQPFGTPPTHAYAQVPRCEEILFIHPYPPGAQGDRSTSE